MDGRVVNIVLVEDDDVDAQAAQRAFKSLKIINPIHRAKDGIEALEMLRGENGKTPIASPHILLIDISMPRMDGLDFLAAIRQDDKFRRTIAFMLTTSKRDEDKCAAYDLNIAGYIVKGDLSRGFIDVTKFLEHYWRLIEFP